ncbi:MAG: DUF1549 and DUF1553 domain-containing protein [Limisphaerales bacterium]
MRDSTWMRNGIDRFILARLESEGIAPSQEASRSTLVRRLSLDLTGLPPAPEVALGFVNDDSPEAYSRLVERLLASPQFGERQAQDWFDLARFADTSGYAADRTRNVWPYRDWVIAAFNENMPFDRFSIDQLAGDLLPGATPEQRVASAFHRHAMQAKGNNPRKEEFRIKGIVDRLEATGRTWLGLTLECAECHDHKHDPISQREYYELFAIFNNVPHLGTGYGVHGPLMKYTPPAVGLAKAAPTIEVPVMDELPQPRETHLLVRGDFKNKGERVTAGTPKILPPLKAKGSEPPNRLDFARWLFSADQPLTARVAVNRIWRHHFGEGLVRTVADFGRYGDRPLHPGLLDWLAVRFVESGWDVKAMHRLIVSSATYRQASRRRPAAELVDPQNRLLAWFPRVRLPAEQIRDGALAAAGQLSSRIGGPSVFPVQPAGLYEERGQDLPGNSNFKWVDSTGEGRFRRSVYTYWKRMMLHPVMATFDAPTRQVCMARRAVTNTPQQALVGLNEPGMHAAAQDLAKRLAKRGSDAAKVEQAFWICFSRPPDALERAKCLAFIKQQRLAKREEWTALAAVLLNLDERLTRE